MSGVTFTMLTPTDEVATNIGIAAQTMLSSARYDEKLTAVGTEIIAMAKSTLSATGTGGSKKELSETVDRIGWAREPIKESARGSHLRVGLVVSDHPASVRYEYGTAQRVSKEGGKVKEGYTATKFMSKSAMSVASRHRGKFTPGREIIATNIRRKTRKKEFFFT